MEVERPLVWRGGVSAPAFTSQLSAAAVRDPPHHSAPAQDRWQRGATGGLLWAAEPNQRARVGHRTTLLGHMLFPSETQVLDAYMAISLLRNTDIN